MTRWQFDNKMTQMLQGVVGKRFLSFERDTSVEGQSYCTARLNFDDISILLKNEEEEIAIFEDDVVPYEEAAKFTCSISDPNQPFASGLDGVAVKKHIVDELVMSVAIASDTIQCIDHGVNIIIDMALIIRTENHTYIFSKSHVWFDEVISINIDRNIDDICPLLSDLNLWNNDGAWNVTVKRTVRNL